MKINLYCSQPAKPESFIDGVKISPKEKGKDKVAVWSVADNSFSALRTQLEKTTSTAISIKCKGTLADKDINSLVAVLTKAKEAGKTITVRFKTASCNKDDHQFGFKSNQQNTLVDILQSQGIAIRD
jgi:hypothetical protein